MNSQSSRTHTVLLSAGGLLLVATTPQDASSFSIPHNAVGNNRPLIQRGRSASTSSRRAAVATSITRRRSEKILGAAPTAGNTNNPYARTATRLTAHLAYLDSLHDITSNPHLFPTTSDYIRTLSQLEDETSNTFVGAAPPSAEDFLAQLSTELLRASQNNEVVFEQPTTITSTPLTTTTATAVAVDYANDRSNNSPLYNFAEVTAPAFTSAVGVGAAAATYNPASYSHLSSQMMTMSDNGSGNGVDSGYTTEYAVAAGDAASNAGGYAEHTASGGAPESFAAWHTSQGGSNSLRDLASSIPNDDIIPQQHDVSYVTTQDMSAMSDYFGNGGYPLADNADRGQQAVDFANGFDASTAANAHASSSHIGHLGDAASSMAVNGGGGLRDLASAIPTDQQLHQIGVSFTDDMLGGVNQVMERFGNGGSYVPTAVDSEVGQQLFDNSEVRQQVVAPVMQDVPTAAATDQASSIPQVNSELSNTLSSQLSDLNYDGLQIDGKTSATEAFTDNVHSSSIKPPTDGLLSDSIKSKLDELELPKYHLDLPTISNPFSEVSPSIQNAVSSVKEASEASKEKLDSVFNTMSHSFEGLNDRVAGVSNSFEGLSGQLNKVADAGTSGVKAIGNAVQSGASKLHPPNFNFEAPTLPNVNNLPRPNFPNANIQTPALPTVNFEMPALPELNLPNVNLHPPTLPNLNIMEGTSATVHRIGDASLTDFGNAILSTIKFTGGIIIKFLDLILNAISGTSLSSILSNVQTSVASTIDNASHAVVSTITNIGNMSVLEIIQHLMALVIAITDILLKIMNAVIYIISGKDGAEWALQATSSVNEASSQLLAQATSTYDGVTHTSLTEFTHSVGDYSHYVGNEFVTLIGSLNGVDGLSFDGVSIPADTLDSVATAVQTALLSL